MNLHSQQASLMLQTREGSYEIKQQIRKDSVTVNNGSVQLLF